MIDIRLGAALLAIAAPSSAATPAPAPAARVAGETERNRTIVDDFVRLLFVEHDAKAAYEKYVAADVVEHNSDLTDGRDAAIAMLSKVFGDPRVTFDVLRVLVDGDMTAIHVHARRDPTAKGVVVVNFYRLKDGRIVEHWGVAQPVPETSPNPRPMF